MADESIQITDKPAFVREPAVAGQFYPGDAEDLKGLINKFMDASSKTKVPGRLIGLVEPHAGYVFSGPIAAYGYKQITGKKYETVFVLAPSHRVKFEGVSVIPHGVYRTPLGDVPIDEDIAKKLMIYDTTKIKFNRDADVNEHSLEVQVPFLQVALEEGWKIVPILFGYDRDLVGICSIAAEAIAAVYDPDKHLIIASTDLSHFYSYNEAVSMDKKALEQIKNLNIEGYVSGLLSGDFELCGYAPVLTLMIFTAAQNGSAKILKYANSGDTAGSKAQVVGYASAAFYTEKKDIRGTGENTGEAEEKMDISDKVEFDVSDEQKKMLIDMARKTLSEYLSTGIKPKFDYKDELLEKELGLFVTLRKGSEEHLRGCIGCCFGTKKLRDVLPELAISAAVQDPRFPPVKKDELDKIKIEISLLSPMRRICNPDEIKIPGHGVYVKRGFKTGVFLPQVADETGWDKEEFMANLCAGKACLPPDCWKDPETELHVFTAVKFGE